MKLLALAFALAAHAAPAAELDMAKPPAPGAWAPFSVPTRARFTLANGLRVVYAERVGSPLLTLRLAVRGGTALGQERDAGLVQAMAELLTEGTQAREALALAEAADAAGGAVGAQAGSDHTVV